MGPKCNDSLNNWSCVWWFIFLYKHSKQELGYHQLHYVADNNKDVVRYPSCCLELANFLSRFTWYKLCFMLILMIICGWYPRLNDCLVHNMPGNGGKKCPSQVPKCKVVSFKCLVSVQSQRYLVYNYIKQRKAAVSCIGEAVDWFTHQ